jgi:hypothetical protein
MGVKKQGRICLLYNWHTKRYTGKNKQEKRR